MTQESYIPALSNVDTGGSGCAYHAGRMGVQALCTSLLEFPINCIIHVITKDYRRVGLVNLCPSDRLRLSDLLLLDSASTVDTVMGVSFIPTYAHFYTL